MNYPTHPPQGQYPMSSFQQPAMMHSYAKYPPSQQGPSQSISPTQLLSASPSQLMGGHPAQQIPQPLTLTPAQLLQQQQQGAFPVPTLSQNSPVRMPYQPRYPHERAQFHRQHLDRAPSTPERALSLSHERPPERQPSLPLQNDIQLQADRPSSSASVRSHPAHDLPMMPPPTSRPGTASGTMSRINLGSTLAQQAPIQIAMNRPPTRTGSALASPKQSPRMLVGPLMGTPARQPTSMIPAGNMSNPGLGPPMPTMMDNNMGLAPQMATPAMVMGMGPMNMNPPTPNLAVGGSIMPGPSGPIMGPLVLPQSMQRPDREPIMQPHMRESSVPASREASLPPSSAAPFIGLDSATVAAIGPSVSSLPRQGSQPPQPSPARVVPPPHRSPMPRKIGEISGPADPSPVNVPPIPGTTPGEKLPPHIASLNPAVTKISYLPYVVPKESDAADAASDEDKKPSADEPTTDGDKEGTSDAKSLVKIEDPIPMLTPDEIATLKGVMAHDGAYETVYRANQARMMQEFRTVGPGGRVAWWDRDFPTNLTMNRRPERFDVRYPRQARLDGSLAPRKKGARREGIRIPGKLSHELADRPEQLVPIRLEFDVEHHKMRETFVWNLNDSVITPEMFAQTLVEDYALAPSYHSVITKSIQEQLSDFKAHIASIDTDWKPPAMEIPQSEGPGPEEQEDSDVEVVPHLQPMSHGDDPFRIDTDDCIITGRGTMDEEAVQWWESWRKRAKKEMPMRILPSNRRKKRKISTKIDDTNDASGSNAGERPRAVDEFHLDEKKVHEDLRILIKLDIIVGSMKLDDQFEWDLENQDASPERFAEVYVNELGLGGEFKTAIAHCIREQVQVYHKSLFLVGHPSDGTAVQDDDLRMSFLPSLTSGVRTMEQVQSYTPVLNYLSDGEIERNEKEREKELTKRRKRNTRGRRGIALPDREPNRTYRTPGAGFPELDAATLALAAAANAPTSRRAAAAAASLTIANMVASENGTSVMPLQLPPQQLVPQVPMSSMGKEKKPKWLFKAPEYPATLLRPRAHVTKPTSTTAVESTPMLPPSLLETEPPAPVVTPAPPEAKPPAKKGREAEREAKEKEFADGQHPNIIDGVWHCSNCGCPESIAIGRRKGPLGDKSQCGTCGKFWHRHRRPRPCQYSSDPQFHLNLRNEEQGKTTAKKRGRAGNTAATDGVETPSRQKSELWVEVPTRPPNSTTIPPSEDDRPVSPVSTASSVSEAPLAQQSLKTNGVGQSTSAPVAPPRPSTPDSPQPPAMVSSSPGGDPVSTGGAYSNIPTWLSVAMMSLQKQYPDDKFEAILRKSSPKAMPEWRIKCLDCPGKLYNPGPDDSLANYEVHLKNRQHRLRVSGRVKSGSS